MEEEHKEVIATEPATVKNPQSADKTQEEDKVDAPSTAPQQHNGFKSSALPQPEELRTYLQGILTGDPYNKFCVDCHHNLSTHACLAYGIFICGACAYIHQIAFGGKSRSQIKDVFAEQWDDAQLEAIAPGIGGNKLFYTYL